MVQKDNDRNHVADTVIKLATEAGMQLFVTPMGDTYARIPKDTHEEVHRINSKGFLNWLRDLYYAYSGHGFGNVQKEEIKATLEARAAHSGNFEKVYVRVAPYRGKVYLDLANDAWEVVEIDGTDWRIRKDSPVNFRRPNGMLPLPTPERDHNGIDELKDFIDFPTEDDFILTVSWLIGTYHPSGPYPLLVNIAQAGSGKSTRAKLLGMLIDPRENALRVGLPSPDSIDIAAKNAWLLIFDNLSNVPVWFSDRLCTLSTGGGTSRRKLYEDDEEVLFDAKRPVILTGIDELATRGDLVDRAILVYPQRIEAFRPERELIRDFKKAQPRLLGAVLDGVSSALASYRKVRLDAFRMADFAVWAAAAESGLGWKDGTFVKAYSKNQSGASSLVVESSPVATAIIDLVNRQKETCKDYATMQELLIDLNTIRDANSSGDRFDRAWPKLPNKLSSDLNRIGDKLKSFGIRIVKRARTNKGQSVTLCKEAS